jgi:hypothetical protein
MEYTTNPFSEHNIQAGQMIYNLVSMDEGKTFQFAFLIKEETKYINRHKYKPSIEVRIGLIKETNVLAIPMMVLVNKDFDMLYEGFFNYYQDSGFGKEYLKALSTQDKIYLIFYNENNEDVRTIELNNLIKDDMMEFGMRLYNSKQWSMHDFDIAKEKIYKKYNSPMLLWENLNKINDIID